MKFTQQQINNWKDYERIRQRGRYNMFDPRARRLSTMSVGEWGFCMDHYEALKAQAEKPEQPEVCNDFEGDALCLIRSVNAYIRNPTAAAMNQMKVAAEAFDPYFETDSPVANGWVGKDGRP